MADDVYAKLLALRTGLRHFEAWSAQQARTAGLTPAQHQLLLAIRGHGDPAGPAIGEVADYLLLRHHSVVGLVDRAESADLVRRERSVDDHRVVRLRLTEEGAARLEALSTLHLEELERLALHLPAAGAGLGPVQGTHGLAGSPGHQSEPGEKLAEMVLAGVHDHIEPSKTAVLVDRRWPRGIAKRNAPFNEWCKEIAPSADLHRWYRQKPERFGEFSRRYREELTQDPAREALAALQEKAKLRGVVLITASEDLNRSGAAVLREILVGDVPSRN